MKKTIILFFLVSNNFVFSQEIQNIRDIYFGNNESISKCDSLHFLLNSFDKKTNIIDAYIGANSLLYCKFSDDVFKKFSYFEKGKMMIEEAIKKDPDNVEVKFLRYINQNNIPWFLNYNQNIEEDYKFITSHLNSIDNKDFKNLIIKTLKIYK